VSVTPHRIAGVKDRAKGEYAEQRWWHAIHEGCHDKDSSVQCPSSRMRVCGKPGGLSRGWGKAAEPAVHWSSEPEPVGHAAAARVHSTPIGTELPDILP